jgi:predicted metalloprotease with PDZ domain
VDVPAGARTLDLEFQFLTPTATDQGRVVVTPEMLNLQPEMVVLYPAGYYASRIPVQMSVTLPEGWRAGTALRPTSSTGATTTYETVSLETLVDSPIFAGVHFKQVDLDPAGARFPVRLNIVADEPSNLEIKPEQLEMHRDLVREADALFGVRHFDRYDFLLATSARLGSIGLEHHRSSENQVEPNYFTDWAKSVGDHGLLPHEYAHSWIGKYRRGGDLWQGNYDVPMRNQFLWVYEGADQYFGHVLAARSGMYTPQQALDSIANTAAAFQNRVGREWRPLVDTTNDPIFTARRPQAWTSWQRNEDYYSEGLLIWLDADTLIRERSNGARSLDDWARLFFGGDPSTAGQWNVRTYDFDEIVRTLNAVQPYDWATFLRSRVEARAPAPLEGVARGGYQLVYRETPNALTTATASGSTNLTYSLGLAANREGRVTSVQWEGPAFDAGLAVGVQLIAVNGLAYSGERLTSAVRAGKGGSKPIELIVKDGDHFRTVAIPYYGGLRYPHLERVEGVPARLDAILAGRAPAGE